MTGASQSARTPRQDALDAMALGRFDPGPRDGPHDEWIDAWRRSRVAVEINRATVGSCPD